MRFWLPFNDRLQVVWNEDGEFGLDTPPVTRNGMVWDKTTCRYIPVKQSNDFDIKDSGTTSLTPSKPQAKDLTPDISKGSVFKQLRKAQSTHTK